MSEMRGHFERGRWVEEPEPAPPAPAAGSTDRQSPGASDAHRKIEEAARKAGEDLERAINAWAESARKSLQKR
ncbi:MAG: hypothetical protein GX882_06355 [Methanomicrobiales archaeon]|nr:hypothetical protein [Methanomicrobiales archaeon]